MGTGYHGGFGNTEGAEQLSVPNSSKNIEITGYNTAESKSVKTVSSVTVTNNVHSVPTHSEPNSVSQNYKNGILVSERYFDENGNAYLDIDYTDHGNPKMHPNVPHEHKIHFNKDGKLKRDNEPKGGLNK